MDYKEDLEHAHRLADVADLITKRYYLSQDLRVETKPDSTPVTQADKEVEESLSKIVLSEFGESYLGEEGVRENRSDKIWVVDPIDGTKNFVRGMPVWATLIALTEKEEQIAAVVSAPALGRRWWASKNGAAWTRDVDGTKRKIQTSQVSKISDAFILTSSEIQSDWENIPGGSNAVIELIKSAWRHRAIGDFYNYMLLAEGAADVCFEPGAAQWDVEAPALIVKEAGGSFWTNAQRGAPAEAKRLPVATNGLLGKDVLTSLKLI